MLSTKLSQTLHGVGHDDVEPTVTTSIAVDPVRWDEFQRETRALPIVRIMESRRFQSEQEAENYLRNLMMRTMINDELPASYEEKKADRARRLLLECLRSTDSQQREQKAKQALSHWSGCAEAYIILAQCEVDLQQRVAILEKGIATAVAQIDQSKFADPQGYFWFKLSTRAYMRCRTALAQTLRDQDKTDVALGELKALLELSPADSQGLRYRLLNWLLDLDPKDVGIDEYFERYREEASAFGRYALALWSFVRSGANAVSVMTLREALKANKFVPALLCGAVQDSGTTITKVVRGTALEAIAYHRIGGSAWQRIEGAVEWLRDQCAELLEDSLLLRQIEMARESKSEGAFVGPMPMQLSIANETVWR